MSVPAAFAAWLRSAALISVASSSDLTAIWGDIAAIGEVTSVFADKADADSEAARQVDLFSAPMVVEILQVQGLRLDLFGRPVTLRASRTGYEAGATVFVLAVKELDQVEMTNLTVLRRL